MTPALAALLPAIDDPELDLRRLAARSARLALLVEASSSRVDARRARARLLLLLLSLSCPREGQPKRPWYVPGSVVRLGLEAIRRAWGRAWREVPCRRTLRRHLEALEGVLAIVREPGQRLVHLRRPGRAPRYPDTLRVLEDECEAGWWEREGVEVLRRHPEVRRSPEAWRSRLGGWLAWARSRQLDLFAPARPVLPMPGHELPPDNPAAARGAARLVAQGLRRGGLELLEALSRAGAHLPARAQAEALARPARFARAAALYALALARGDRVRDGWAWIRAALRRASTEEGARALARLGVEPAPHNPSTPGGSRGRAQGPGAADLPGVLLSGSGPRREEARDPGAPPTSGGPPAGSRPRDSVPSRGGVVCPYCLESVTEAEAFDCIPESCPRMPLLGRHDPEVLP